MTTKVDRDRKGLRALANAGELRVNASGLALAGIRAEHPGETPRQHSLRLAARFLTREQMVAAFGWAPDDNR